MVTVLYEEWEMACCGTTFEIGSGIEWIVSKVDESGIDWLDKNQGIKHLKPYFLTDYHYEYHTSYSDDFLILGGKIQKITVICIAYAHSANNPSLLLQVSGFIWDVENSRYRTNPYIQEWMGKDPYRHVDAYRVEIENPVIRPCLPEDWGEDNL